jgi:hypothetical protein
MINPQKGIDLMNNTSIINRILFAVTIFQHLQCLEEMREEEGFETPTWEALLKCFEAQNGQHLPLFW